MAHNYLNPAVVTVSFDPESYTVSESGNVAVTLSLDRGIAAPFTVIVEPGVFHALAQVLLWCTYTYNTAINTCDALIAAMPILALAYAYWLLIHLHICGFYLSYCAPYKCFMSCSLPKSTSDYGTSIPTKVY